MTQVLVVLNNITCTDTEDIAGADEFYLVGGVSDGANTAGLLTQPVSINDGQIKNFQTGGGEVFDFDVPENRVLKVAWVAFDEDAAKDWNKHGETIQKIGGAISGGLATIPNPYTATAAILLPFAINAAGGIMQLDKDDDLGTHARSFPMWAIPDGTHHQSWSVNGGSGWWSSWQYAVSYRVIKGQKAIDAFRTGF